MKPKCQHKFQITRAVTEAGKRVYSLCCPHCGKKATRKVKLPKPYDPSRSHTKAPGSTKARKPIRQVSEKRKAVNAEYSKLRAKFLGEKPRCEVEGCKEASTEVHHKSRRHGKFMLDTSSWLSVCNRCHRRIEENPAWSKAMGYLQYHFS